MRPWNYQDFLLRVRTFKPSSWFAKPRIISALQCARCGWTNTAPDVISCATCEVSLTHASGNPILTFSYVPQLIFPLDDASGKSLYALMTRAHKDHCGWKDNFSPTSFLSFPDTSLETLTDNFITRLQRILRLLENRTVLGNALTDIVIPDQLQQYQAIASVLCLFPTGTPHVAMTISNHSSEMHRIYYRILELLATVTATPETNAEIFVEELHRKRTLSDPHALSSAGYTPPLSLRCAVLLALCGWNVRRVVEAATDTIAVSTSEEKRPSSPLALSHTSVQFLHCDLCDRCISIELLIASDKKPDTRIEPLLQHRFFCPWALPYIRPPPESIPISTCGSLGGDEERSDVSTASTDSIPIPPVPLSGYPGWLLTAEAIVISSLGYSVCYL